MIDFNNTALIVAHPIDELMFFSSVLDKVDHIYFCFHDKSEYGNIFDIEKKYLKDDSKFYKIPSSRLSQYNFTKVDLVYSGIDVRSLSNDMTDQYYKNYLTLYNILELEILKYSTIITHNPWGEYYQAEHIQVNRILTDLCIKHNKELWINGKTSPASKEFSSNIIDVKCIDNIKCTMDESYVSSLYELYYITQFFTADGKYTWELTETLFKYNTTK